MIKEISKNGEIAMVFTSCFLSQRNKVKSITTPDLRAHSKKKHGTSIEINPWKRTKSPEINPHTYNQLIFTSAQIFILVMISSINGTGKTQYKDECN